MPKNPAESNPTEKKKRVAFRMTAVLWGLFDPYVAIPWMKARYGVSMSKHRFGAYLRRALKKGRVQPVNPELAQEVRALIDKHGEEWVRQAVGLMIASKAFPELDV